MSEPFYIDHQTSEALYSVYNPLTNHRTLQRNDIAMAITKFDQFDFLIDIVPRDDIKPAARKDDSSVRMAPDQVWKVIKMTLVMIVFFLQVSYYFQLAQQHQQSLQNNSSSSSGGPQQQSTQQQIQGQQQVVQSGVQTINVGQQQSQPQVK